MGENATNEKVQSQAVELAELRAAFDLHFESTTGLLEAIGRQSSEQMVGIVRLQEQHKALGDKFDRQSAELGRGMKRIGKLETAATSGKTLYTVFVGLGSVATAFGVAFMAIWIGKGD